MESAFSPNCAEHDRPHSTAAAATPGLSEAHARIEEIEQLYTAGLSTYDIAYKLNLRPRDVGRNLREIRKRYQRAARRQTRAFAVGQCAAIQSEAMEGWRRSQESKLAVTIRRKSGEPDVVTTRTENRPGNASFLNTALRAMKQLRDIAAEAPAEPRKAIDAARVALLEVLTPAQVASLAPEQIQQFRTALDRWSVVLNTVGNELHPTDATTQDPPAAEPPVETPEVQISGAMDAAASDEAAKDGQTSCAAHNGPQQMSRKTAPPPRHPEWPAESVLTRSWLPPDHDFASNGRENAIHLSELPGQQVQLSP